MQRREPVHVHISFMNILQTSWEQLPLPLGPSYPNPSAPDQNHSHVKQTEMYDFSKSFISLGSAALVFMKRISLTISFFQGYKITAGSDAPDIPLQLP